MTLEVVTKDQAKSGVTLSIQWNTAISIYVRITLSNWVMKRRKKIFGTGWKIIILRAKEVQPQISGIVTREGITDSDWSWKLDTNNRT